MNGVTVRSGMIAVAVVLSSVAISPTAEAAGSNMPWEQPLNQILQSVEGPVAKMAAMAGDPLVARVTAESALASGDVVQTATAMTVWANSAAPVAERAYAAARAADSGESQQARPCRSQVYSHARE